VDIEQLVLHGFAPGEGYSIGESVKRELARLCGERGVSPSLIHNSQGMLIDAGVFNVVPGSTVEAIGAQVARAVYGGLTP
jgi:hypothetical protein